MKVLGVYKSWNKFTEEMNGKFQEESMESNMPHISFKIDGDEVIYKIEKIHNKILPRFQTYLKMELNYKEVLNFRFFLEKINKRSKGKENEIDGIEKIEIADSEFNDKFSIYTNNEEYVRIMMNKSVIKRLICGIPVKKLSIETVGKKKYICIKTQGVAKNIETLRKMYYLIIEILGCLQEI
ncbi:DUF3137 domain-containing protein [Oceanirhabdus sp. W0125-5]|uniref:DUF3137 domain-containing protein n=1 Tax=Oceanirhabdus sp. W0125-5 TaxID=2999116 RepID=UPI0022F2F731|nr:DUF3137 domain-containing protein [Oceanirhabdus sp. W0125-5]WBW98243.1 DUF3137 domain-containing protein [Oceanirhabdus sp. W0125-5]